MMNTPKTSYTTATEQIKEAILSSQYTAAKQVNAVQLSLYYGVGRYVSQNTRKGVWGTGAIKAISEQLHKELPGLRGFSERNIKNMRAFYEAWQELDINSAVATAKLQVIGNKIDTNLEITISKLQNVLSPHFDTLSASSFLSLPFTHHLEILKEVKDNKQRLYYIRWAIENKASVISLKRALATDIYNVQPIPNNFSQTLPSKNLARKAVEMFKDEYLLDFINVEEIGERDLADIDERVVEQQIIHNVKNFIMTFGRDFTFVGNQYHLEVFEVEQYPDLLFFNRELNCLVCVELKKGDFKPSYLGQLTAYLRILDDTVKKPHENPTIGIILCKDFNKDFVEYVIQDYHKPMGVARYTTTAEMPEQFQRVLPNIEELRKVLSNQPTDK
ncbi:YhcG family protein [Capnocytophaga sputigena]|uniref:PDDEXK nuclease domain-containing protein n=1 Tax=Capnocytophaga sputigena TaxID=1019 RepID=UPI0028E39309|nr:PDDEXK nuclease domain-containing protein [Capnocytophaga sputigena]